MGEQFLQRDLYGFLGVAVLVVIRILVLQRRAQRLDPAVDQFGEPILDDDAQLVADFVPPAGDGAHERIAVEAADRQHRRLEAVEQIATQRHEALALRQVRQPGTCRGPPSIEVADHLVPPGSYAGIRFN
ncbi:hypothetical protein [Niveispirillum sp.]|uniref:hypothetical protein n=1 Tax=Niveispirillum sp. TaxID=1917217 RepID=UPI001B410A75|nr:hypothetical protein [Niveispirillum sp.]MBP7338709.1 hypothetical protein [Niveispirillum sp.]